MQKRKMKKIDYEEKIKEKNYILIIALLCFFIIFICLFTGAQYIMSEEKDNNLNDNLIPNYETGYCKMILYNQGNGITYPDIKYEERICITTVFNNIGNINVE